MAASKTKNFAPPVNILLLGGSSEASLIARKLAELGLHTVFSYAGRTLNPAPQPLPVRIGGFGGVSGLAAFLTRERITHVIDATHPFAAQMSAHAVIACKRTGVKLAAFERAPWREQPGDRWLCVDSMEEAVTILPQAPARIFLAIGRKNIAAFSTKPQHSYLLRLVDDTPATPDWPPQATILFARGPFDFSDDLQLLKKHGITHVVAKNSGGFGAFAKILAARALELPVVMIQRPKISERQIFEEVEDVLSWIFITP